ncbi:MAG: alanine racemase [Sneathiella sp.]|nr:alanine racemase [Sneathiella sp.]
MDPRLAGAYLTIDLTALQSNYKTLTKIAGNTECAAVVKADAYGLGASRVAPALNAVGCRKFFVALPSEAVRLRKILPEVKIFVLGGLFEDCAEIYVQERLTPVLNRIEEIKTWSAMTADHGPLPAILHIDSGITRLGLMEPDIRLLAGTPQWLDGLEINYIMSHLACADDPTSSQNQQQLEQFDSLRKLLPEALQSTPVSFANSSGMFLGEDYLFDLARPGIALYGGNPTPTVPNPMKPVVHLQGKILQIHDVDSQKPIGYGATYRTSRKARIATVSVGYADGYFRCLGNQAECAINDKKVPVVGRVSMDMISIDVTDIALDECKPGDLVSLIGGPIDINSLATDAGTISYEILTSLGPRYHRLYLDVNL